MENHTVMKRKTFFSQTVGSRGLNVHGVFRSHDVESSVLCCHLLLPDLFFVSAFFICFFLSWPLMAKESLCAKSYAVRRLQPYNKSASGPSRDGRDAGRDQLSKRAESSLDSRRGRFSFTFALPVTVRSTGLG